MTVVVRTVIRRDYCFVCAPQGTLCLSVSVSLFLSLSLSRFKIFSFLAFFMIMIFFEYLSFSLSLSLAKRAFLLICLRSEIFFNFYNSSIPFFLDKILVKSIWFIFVDKVWDHEDLWNVCPQVLFPLQMEKWTFSKQRIFICNTKREKGKRQINYTRQCLLYQLNYRICVSIYNDLENINYPVHLDPNLIDNSLFVLKMII